MVQARSVIPLLITSFAVILYLLLRSDDAQYAPSALIELPDDAPDIYMTDVDITRYNTDGELLLNAKGDSLAVYQERQLSQFNQPIILLMDRGTQTWKITSDIAYINEENLIEFHQNVVAIALTSTPEMTLETEFLSVNNALQTIDTNLPIQLTQGSQRINAIGMDAKMDTMDAIIHFQSEVSFVYDPQIAQ